MTRRDKQELILRGVGTNNLRGIDVAFPLGQMTVVTGVSGSGKSSLVFDTLYAEAYRRYVESLSSFARQYLQSLPKPVIREAVNILPAIAVKQGRSTANSRSTVGTATEIHDLLRVIFTHTGEVVCPGCGAVVERDSGESVARKWLDAPGASLGGSAVIAASLAAYDIAAKDLREHLMGQGFTRAWRQGALVRLSDVGVKELKSCDVVVDRVTVDPSERRRFVDSLSLAFRVGRGRVRVIAESTSSSEANSHVYSDGMDCPACHRAFREPSPALLSFNHPLGACPACQGFGMTSELDWEKIVPDRSLSLKTGGVAPWNTAFGEDMIDPAVASAKRVGIAPSKPFADYTRDDWKWIESGDGKRFPGVRGYFEWVDKHRHKPHYRIHSARFKSYRQCVTCSGARLVPDALACRVDGKTIADVAALSVDAFAAWLDALDVNRREPPRWRTAKAKVGGLGVDEAVEEARARVDYLKRIGLGYLTLDRSSRTLSGGEWQRINMARCLGSALTETLYCLDEPTSGLHPRDSGQLLRVMREMRDQGNTVVVVEHEREIIRGADHIIEIGPDAGARGGELVYAGDPSSYPGLKESRQVTFPLSTRDLSKAAFLEISGVTTNNLRGVSARVPAGALTVVCGVSGSGKTSLIQHTLFPMLAESFGERQYDLPVEPRADRLGPKSWITKHTQALLVSQQGIGRSSRSNVATYLGFFDQVRSLLASTPSAKALSLTPGHFSFNAEGGRCETCRGLGRVVEDLSFLGEMEVVCPSCRGNRFTEKVLRVDYRGKTINDILRLTLEEAREFFFDRAPVVRALDTLIGMGLGYIQLGQSTSSFSGGEAQRLKLAHLLLDMKSLGRSILIFDEPTTGLSDRDVSRLVAQMRQLADAGHTIIVVEHHTGVIRSADWLIEIGPGSAHMGGRVVFQGTPKDLGGCAESVTRAFL